jgi:hypothetical protein
MKQQELGKSLILRARVEYAGEPSLETFQWVQDIADVVRQAADAAGAADVEIEFEHSVPASTPWWTSSPGQLAVRMVLDVRGSIAIDQLRDRDSTVVLLLPRVAGTKPPMPTNDGVSVISFVDRNDLRGQAAHLIYTLALCWPRARRDPRGDEELREKLQLEWSLFDELDRRRLVEDYGVDPERVTRLLDDKPALAAASFEEVMNMVRAIAPGLLEPDRGGLGLMGPLELAALERVAREELWSGDIVARLAVAGLEELAKGGQRRFNLRTDEGWQALYDDRFGN